MRRVLSLSEVWVTEVTIVAPVRCTRTGASQDIIRKRILFMGASDSDFDGDAYSVNGPPALCVIISR